MKNLIVTLFASLFLLAAGNAAAQSHDGHAMPKGHTMPMDHAMHGTMQHEHSAQAVSGAAQAEIVDGVQVVNIEVGKTGFKTDSLALRAGVPARLVFTRTEEGGCAFQVKIPEFGIEPTDLPLNEAVAIEFTPTESGNYTFLCGMNMLKGAILVRS